MAKRRDPKKLWAYTKIALHVTMGLLYIIIGSYVIEKEWFIRTLSQELSYALGAVLITYGLFRIYRIYKSSKE